MANMYSGLPGKDRGKKKSQKKKKRFNCPTIHPWSYIHEIDYEEPIHLL